MTSKHLSKDESELLSQIEHLAKSGAAESIHRLSNEQRKRLHDELAILRSSTPPAYRWVFGAFAGVVALLLAVVLFSGGDVNPSIATDRPQALGAVAWANENEVAIRLRAASQTAAAAKRNLPSISETDSSRTERLRQKIEALKQAAANS